jgi:hypothetical protein
MASNDEYNEDNDPILKWFMKYGFDKEWARNLIALLIIPVLIFFAGAGIGAVIALFRVGDALLKLFGI